MKEILNELLDMHLPLSRWRNAILEYKQQRDTKQSLSELPFKHSKNFGYIQNMTPLWVRLRLSKYRGNRRAISWRIKLMKILNIVGPRTADLLLEEYMITAKVKEPTLPNSWTCPKCGTNNADTALFCKDCGEYK